MSEQMTLKVYGRNGLGKNESFRLREQNKVPAVVYGHKIKGAVTVSVSPRDVLVTFKKAGRTGLVTLEAVDGAPAELNGTKVLFKELQSHPLRNTLTHVDFHQLDLSKKVRVAVPLKFTGKAKGMAEGGLMTIYARSAEVRVLPTEIPSFIEVDVTDLGMNDTIHVEELAKKTQGAKYEFIYEADYALAGVLPPEEEEKAAEATADAAAPGAAGAPAAAGAAPAAGAPAAAGAKAPAAGAKAAPGADKAKK